MEAQLRPRSIGVCWAACRHFAKGTGHGKMLAMLATETKVWVFLIFIGLGFLFVGEHWGGRAGLLLGFTLAVALNALFYFLGESRLLTTLGARPLRGVDAWGLSAIVEKIAKRMNRPVPQLFVMNHPTATAFSTGLNSRRPSLCVSTGLLEKFPSEDLEAVLAQQLCQQEGLNRFGFGVASVVSNTLMRIGDFLDALWPPNFFFGKKQRPFLTLLSPLGWLILRPTVNRAGWYETDRAAAELIQSRERLGEALWRLEGLAQARPLRVPPCTGHLFIVNPEGGRQRNFFLRSHPPLRDRLRALIGTPTV